MKQKTIGHKFEFAGKGLHTGLKIRAVFKPAEENTGIRLCRVDLPDKPCYEARTEYVSATERGTVLAHGEWKISTVEHALSALYALGVTNCLIELDAPEMPILDGSADPFVKAILAAGIVEQEAEANTYVVKERVLYMTENGSEYIIEPAEREEFEVGISFPGKILHDQTAELKNLEDYPTAIASARTFCFVREIAYLLGKGLIKGGDLQNALVIYEYPMSQEQMDQLTDALGQPRQDATKLGYISPLKYENEPARHKLLDLIGDFSLLGVRLQGKITAFRPGHGPNTECARFLAKKFKLQAP
ncbi:MAG: UDP-3-O-acyl-N-acetylglucosamine deacetylase [Paludibacteraceae bacterium]|nr:UDP-3-O-acyl-N-acetylglucosamine deacetylase [Paludibacteraceae bacterium]